MNQFTFVKYHLQKISGLDLQTWLYFQRLQQILIKRFCFALLTLLITSLVDYMYKTKV